MIPVTLLFLTLLVPVARCPGPATASPAQEAAPAPATVPTATAECSPVVPGLEILEFHSQIFQNDRKLRVLLPSGYFDPSAAQDRYRVLYLNDGQNLFDPATSLFNPIEWQVDETVAALIAKGEIEPLIVVGIDNAGRRLRANEYLPWADAFLSPPLPDPQGRRYPDFLVQEVLPLIDGRYRTKTGPENTGLGGSSYGGLIALYTALHQPGRFGFLLIESPSLYVHDGAILQEAAQAASWPERVYLGVGTNEAGLENCAQTEANLEPNSDVMRLSALLQAAGLGRDRLKVEIEACARHDEAAWARRLPAALRFLLR